MEINPAARIREVSAVKPPKNDPQLSAAFDIEEAFGPQQDTFSQNEGKMTGEQDEGNTGQEYPSEPSEETPNSNSGSTVNLFA